MTSVLRDKHRLDMKRPRREPYRVLDYQHVSVPSDFSAFARTSSSSSGAPRHSRGRPQTARSRGAQLGLEELLCIKKELTVIKSQIDELLVSLEQMEPDGDGVTFSPLHGSVSSADDSAADSPPSRTDRDTRRTETTDAREEDRQHVHEYGSDLFYL